MSEVASTPEFRCKILAVILYTDWLTRYGTILIPAYFPTNAEKELLKFINSYYEDYGSISPCSDLYEYFNDADDVTGLLDQVQDVGDEDISYTADRTLEFCKTQAMKIAILQSVDCIRDGDLSTPLQLVREAQTVGSDTMALGRDLVRDARDWVYDELHGRRFPTGIPMLDAKLQGGLVAGEYGLVMAPPGCGKTTMLINIGFAMAGLTGVANVLHVTYEMPEQKVLKRYAMRVAGITFRRGQGGENKYIHALEDRARALLRGRLRVVQPFDTSTGYVRQLLDNLAAVGFSVDALIIDYPDLMKPSRKRREYRFELADLARELRLIGQDYGIPVWGATQAGRHAIYKEIIHIGDVAEAIEKAAIADLVMSICQTRDEQKLGIGRLFMAKIRDAEDKLVVPVKLNFAKQSITQRSSVDALLD